MGPVNTAYLFIFLNTGVSMKCEYFDSLVINSFLEIFSISESIEESKKI